MTGIPNYRNLVNGMLAMNDAETMLELQRKITENDQSAYRQLFIMYYDKLLRFVMVFARNKELSEEIVSDVFINIWRRRAKIGDIENLKLYLYVSAKNITFNYLAKLNREKFTNLDMVKVEPEAPFANPSEAMITREMNIKLKEAIDELPPRCKLIFKLIKEDGLSYKHAAKVLNLSVSTIDNQLGIAIKKIAGAIQYSLKHQ